MEKNTHQIEQNYRWDFEKSFSCSEKYEQFINWLSVEFYSLQQDQGSFLTIYFPNGEIKVTKEEGNDATFVSKISVVSKCRKVGMKIKKNLLDFFNHIENYNRISYISIMN